MNAVLQELCGEIQANYAWGSLDWIRAHAAKSAALVQAEADVDYLVVSKASPGSVRSAGEIYAALVDEGSKAMRGLFADTAPDLFSEEGANV